jgi:hypothetical protein
VSRSPSALSPAREPIISAMRIGGLVLAGLLLTVLPGCVTMPTPPTPVLSGPDTGRASAPVAFTAAFTQEPGGWGTYINFDWGDGGSFELHVPVSDSYSHIYVEPGVYAARCYLTNGQLDIMDFDHYRDGKWSSPCTVEILDDTTTACKRLVRR